MIHIPYWSSKYLCSLELKNDKINAIAILAILTLALQRNSRARIKNISFSMFTKQCTFT